ncbi:MAG: alkaline phosphatase family protein [Anaerolineae bacterium]|jgi:predicted AlkP superfamily phosphohydrolase/phosphomutase
MHTLILGFDAFDPATFERLSAAGRLPHLTRYAAAGGYAPFQVPQPPQSEVSWTSIATGLDPGGHGIFDFVHRDPATYRLSVSLLPMKKGLAGTQFVPPFTARTIFDEAVARGYPATALWWPATFPARPESPVRTIPGLGTPDIQGRLGVGTLFAAAGHRPGTGDKTPIVALQKVGASRYEAGLPGPVRQTRTGPEPVTLPLRLDFGAGRGARLDLGSQHVDLVEGEWSPVVELSFKVGLLMSVKAITRAILVRGEPDVQLYLLPLQLHPLKSMWRYATPGGFVKDAWRNAGPFLTLGWQQDTTALEEACITDEQFLELCDWIMRVREGLLMHLLDGFDEGILASVFDSLDRIQHMFLRDRPDLVDAWYARLDALLGRVEARLAAIGRDPRIVVISDHGFAPFEHKVHLNRWLVDHGHLATRNGDDRGSLHDADWSRTRAYAVGLNSLYVNLMGREGQGTVSPVDRDRAVEELRRGLLAWQGPDGRPVVRTVTPRDEAFSGPHAAHGPDLVVGYAPGHRASADTGLGKWDGQALVPNRDHWGADHCMAADAVPGVLFCSQGLAGYPHPSYRDVPALTIGAGVAQHDAAPPPPPSLTDEDEELVEDRLRGLGYL